MQIATHPSPTFLLAALSDAVGQAVALDANGECGIEFEPCVEVVVAQAQDGALLTLRSALSPEAQLPDASALCTALALNYTSMPPGFSIALDESTGQLFLVTVVEAAATSPDEFVSRVAAFVQLVPAVRARCDCEASRGGAALVGPQVLA